jgi:transcriptional regulator with XRE-family HTH domain
MTPASREMVGHRVATRRHQHGLTQHELAEKADMALVTLNRVERGHQSLSMETLAKLATSLETTADYLLGLSDDPERPRPGPQPRRRSAPVTAG